MKHHSILRNARIYINKTRPSWQQGIIWLLIGLLLLPLYYLVLRVIHHIPDPAVSHLLVILIAGLALLAMYTLLLMNALKVRNDYIKKHHGDVDPDIEAQREEWFNEATHDM